MTSLPQTPRVVLDTNVLLDWLVFREPAALALAHAVLTRRWIWCATPAMLDELRHVLGRPLEGRWRINQELALTTDICATVTLCTAPPPASRHDAAVCRDPADQMFIDLALAQHPCWLVTRDRALLALRRRAAARDVVIGTPEHWYREHRSATTEPIQAT